MKSDWKETTPGETVSTSGKIQISISREHSRYSKDIEDCFQKLNASVDASYVRKSAGELPIQIIIFLGSSILSGFVYDLIKAGINKLFSKFQKAQITVRDAHSIMFSIDPHGRVVPIVVRSLREKYSHIKNLDDLFSYLQKTDCKKGMLTEPTKINVEAEMNIEEIKNKIKQCLRTLYQNDSILFERNSGKGLCERCIVFRFAYYLQNNFPDYSVDCDFNSASIDGRPVNGKPIIDPNRRTSTKRFVDIIVHNRTFRQASDFICFEIKKWNNNNMRASEKDKNNLRVLTSEYGYRYGFYLILGRTINETKWGIFQSGESLSGMVPVF
jgi:hypothetical protein